MSARTKKKNKSTGTVSISIIVLAFLIVMTIQIYRVKEKDDAYGAKEQDLIEQYDQESQRADDIDALQEYMKSDQYVEDVAKSKLGLSYDNEIIFKEKKD